MSPKGAARRSPAKTGIGALSLPVKPGEQNEAPGATPAQHDLSELAGQVLGVAAELPGVAGVRLWRLADGKPTVWQETGTLPPSDAMVAEKALSNRPSTESNEAHWACALGEKGEVPGVLEIHGARPLGGKVRSLLQVFAHIAGVALTNADRQQAVEELSTIVEATKRLNSTLNLGELMNIILQLATRLIRADRGTVFLVDREHKEIWSLVGLGLEEQEIHLPIGQGIAGWVADHGQTVCLENVYDDPRFEPGLDRRLRYVTHSLLCLPIRNKAGDIVAVLELLNKKDGPFNAADERFIGYLSDHVALALENAQLHRERLAKQRMERDLELARSIQRGLLPEHPPRLDGFEVGVAYTPSQMVSGDYYDFVPLNPHALLTVTADVEGKGVASALVMANLQATLRALAAHVHGLEQIVSSVNNMILADTRGQKYLSMFVGLLDQRNRGLHYINAGHVPPTVIRADDTVAYLREGGMVVGIFPDVTYERGYLPLRTGDVVVSYTDGITESRDRGDNEFGLERLVMAVRQARSLPAQQIAESVLTAVDRFSRGGHNDDDRVILILKVL